MNSLAMRRINFLVFRVFPIILATIFLLNSFAFLRLYRSNNPSLEFSLIEKSAKLLKSSLEYVEGSSNRNNLSLEIFNGSQETCIVNANALQFYPQCISKMQWFDKNWRSHECYAKAGVDGSRCSFVKYLNEYEDLCPPIESRRPLPHEDSETVSSLNLNLDQLLGLVGTDRERNQSAGFMKSRISRLWPIWKEGALFYSESLLRRNISSSATLVGHRKLKLLIHLGLMVIKGFNDGVNKGGPLGELLQWSDLLAAVHVLGHEATLTMTEMDLKKAYNLPATVAKVPCIKTARTFDIVFTDIMGYKQINKLLQDHCYRQPPCTFRIVDTFGTQSKFNCDKYTPLSPVSRYFAAEPPSSWSGLSLYLKQFYTLFPHTIDNSFLGFVVERSDVRSQYNKSRSQRPIALVYGKQRYMWEPPGIRDYISILGEYFDVHATVSDPNKDTFPNGVTNHGLLHGQKYMALLRSAKIFVGLGFPYEGPAPLEAIANGVIFVNPSFSPPHSRYNIERFKNKPTARNVTSQSPYIEESLGPPYSYHVNISNHTDVRRVFEMLQAVEEIDGHIPFEFTSSGMLERLHAYLSYQRFCPRLPPPFTKENYNSTRSNLDVFYSVLIDPASNSVANWPPQETSLAVFLADPGDSCSHACRSYRNASNNHRYVCCQEHFTTLNDHVRLHSRGINCSQISIKPHLSLPALNIPGDVCYLQSNQLLFDCEAPGELLLGQSIRRVCPCRDVLPGQSALCESCL